MILKWQQWTLIVEYLFINTVKQECVHSFVALICSPIKCLKDSTVLLL